MKLRNFVLTTLLLLCPVSVFSQIKWNTSMGFDAGLGHVFGKLYDDGKVVDCYSKRLFIYEMNIMGVYAAMNLGLGSSNADSPIGFNIGPSFKFAERDYSRWTIAPYIGFMRYSHDYGSNSFIFGAKASYVYGLFEIGAHLNNKEIGATIGIDFLYLDTKSANNSYSPPYTPYTVPLKERK